MTLFEPFFTPFLQGEAGEAGNPGPHGEPGAAVSAVSCWSMQIISYIFLTLTKFPGRLTVIYRLLVSCCVCGFFTNDDRADPGHGGGVGPGSA